MSSRRKQARPRSYSKHVADSDDDDDLSDLSLQTDNRREDNNAGEIVYLSAAAAGESMQDDVDADICIEPKDVKNESLWLPDNKLTEDGRFRCDICSSEFTNLDDFMDHKNLDCVPDHNDDNQWTIDTLAANVKNVDSVVMDTSPGSVDSSIDSPLSPNTENLDPELLPAGLGVSELNPYGCHFCEKSFPRLSYLKIHEQIHSDQLPFKCDYCKRLFRHKRSRDRHVKLHTGDKNYKCNQCQSAFARSDHLKSHLRTHESGKSFACSSCDMTFGSISALNMHQQTHKENGNFECPQCTEIFLTSSDLHLHQIENNHNSSSQLQCSLCGQSFSRQETLEQHVQNVHLNGQGNKCPFCDVCFMNIDQLCIHIKTHGTVVMSSGDLDGQMNIGNSSTLSSTDQIRLSVNDPSRNDISDKARLGVNEEGRLTMNEVLVCPYCFCSDFDSLEILEIHMQSVHSVKPTEVYTCNYCNAPYQNLYSLHEHMRAVHQEQPCMDIKYPCGICTQHFPSIDALVQHKRSAHYNDPQEVHGIEPLFCIYCQMTFKNHRDLREHVMCHTSPATPNKLRSCLLNPTVNGNDKFLNKREVKQQNVLKRSESTIHHSQPSDQNHYKEQIICDHCNSTFYDMKNFEAHVKLHLDDVSTKFSCKICKENFVSEDRLEKHASNHYLSMTTEYGCTTCMKLFSKPDELQKHLMDIHAHHLYRCSLCKEIFDSKVNIQVHFAIKHSNECKLYKCTKCESVFRSEMEWQVHVRVNHLHVAKPYRCLFCKESFTAEIDLQCHLTTHNKPFRCSMCEESFHVEYLLDKHLQSEHSNSSDHVVPPQLSPLKIKVERDCASSSLHFSTSPKSATGSDVIGNWKNSDFIVNQLHPSPSPKMSDIGIWKKSESNVRSLLGVKSEEIGIWKNYESNVKTGHSSTSPKTSEAYIKHADSSNKTLHCSPSPKTGNLSIWKSSELFHTCNICDAKFEQQALLLTHKAVDHGLSAKISSASSSPTLNESPRQEQNIVQQQQTTQQQMTQLQQGKVVSVSESVNGTMSLPVVVVSEKVCLACMFCSQTFKNRADLDKHVKIHSNGGSQKCNICDQVFPSSSILAEHKLTHCKIQHGNSCVLCKIPLKNEEHFYVHTQEHGFQNSGFMQCLICRQTLSSMVELQMHGKHHFQIKPSFFTCCVCLKTFDTKENLVSKLNSSGRTYYVCKPCYHGDSGSTHVCKQCGAQFSNAKHLEAHTCTHSKNTYQCIKCQESFNSEYEIQLHVATHVLNEGNTHECKLCSETFESPAKLQCHLIEHTYKDSEFRCSVCCKLFQSSVEIQTHAIEHGLNSRRYACNQCPQKFFFSAELENHMFSHADYSKIHCNQCDRTFSSVINLNNHMKIHEKKEQNFKCSLCPKVLDSMNALQQHFFSGHSNSELATTKKVYPCTECDKEFPCLSNLQGHMRIHKPGVKFPCPICKKVFALSRNLNIHMRSHSGEKPYECPICRKRFARKENRKAHLRSHGGLKPFLCPVCGKSFTRKCHVKEHMKVHFTPDTPAAEIQSVIEVDVNGDPGSCTSEDTCGQEVSMEESSPFVESSPLPESSHESVVAADKCIP